MSPLFLKRLLAFLLDIAFLLLLFGIAFLALNGQAGLQLSLIPGFILYKTISECLFMTTPGKLLTGLQIRDKYGYRVGRSRCFVRNIHLLTICASYVLDELLRFQPGSGFPWDNIGLQIGIVFLLIDGIFLLSSSRNQALHDIPAGTYVED